MSAVIAEKTTREIAQEIVLSGGKHSHGSIMCFERNTLVDAIDKALRDRDERAAGILEAGAMLASPVGVIPEGDPEHEWLARMTEVLTKAALAIRGYK